MTGLVWFVQIVHYPLYTRVGAAHFVRYETDHTQLTTYVVLAPMLVELVSSIALLLYPPARSPILLLWAAAALTGAIWLSTLLFQIPLHGVLSAGFDETAQRQLVSTNWWRTAAWTARSGILLWIASRAVK